MRKYQRVCVTLCREAGLNPNRAEHRGKHLAVVCDEGRVFCPCTPSDHRRAAPLTHNVRSSSAVPILQFVWVR
jgi:hypothetical protein